MTRVNREGEPKPAKSRRERLLSEDERALWDSIARQAKPLRKPSRAKSATDKPVPSSELPAMSAAAPNPVNAKAKTSPVAKSARLASAPPRLATLGRRERTQLSRGRIEIDARLDLHGMTQTRAHRALLRFLQQASHDGLRFVLVITGKGRATGEDRERGVLRRQVPEWLGLPEFRALVVGFDEAHIGHGGGGALYVRVRRAR
jgi:DNA-nicking Smr family endonuclease